MVSPGQLEEMGGNAMTEEIEGIHSCQLCGVEGKRNEFKWVVLRISHWNLFPETERRRFVCSDCWATLHDSVLRNWGRRCALLRPIRDKE